VTDPGAALSAMLRRLRERRQLTQEELAARSGLSVGTVRGLESGRIRRPRAASLRQLADALGLGEEDRARLATARAEPVEPRTGRDPPPGPAQLPAAVGGFTGRREALGRLDAVLGDGPPRAPVVISGAPGVGKTALALHWAHRVADRFPDGQLYLDLRGFSPDEPLDPAHALSRLLSALDTPGRSTASTLDELAAWYRTKVAHRRMLVVLDNAACAEQVRPLLPGSGTCAVVVTSRDRLAGLVAVDGAHRVELGLLTPTESLDLLGTLVGERVRTEPDAAARLAELCGRLPLALRIAAELAASQPDRSLAQLVAELADLHRRLELLDAGGDPRATVVGVFSWSLRHLDEPTERAFRLMALHPTPDIDRYALAALAGTSPVAAGRLLENLARANLAYRTGRGGRYGVHDLLRAYARELCATRETDEQRHAARTRMLDYYLGTAAAAMDVLFPAETHRRPRVPEPATGAPDLAGHDDARGWLDEHRAVLVAAAHLARDGWPAHASHLSRTLARYLDEGHHVEALAVHECAYRAAAAAGDRTGQVAALVEAGRACHLLGRYGAAAGYYGRALTLLHDADDPVGLARALNGLGAVERARGRVDRALDYHRWALRLYRRAGESLDEAGAPCGAGPVDERPGRQRGATDRFRRSLASFRRLGDRVDEVVTLTNLGTALTRLGRPDLAVDHHREAVDLSRKVGYPHGELWALNGLGEAAQAAGRSRDALTYHGAALTAATAVMAADQEARAHVGLGRAYQALGEPARARPHYERALSIYRGLGTPEADTVAGLLATLDHRSDPPTE
jgi:tetratricopeptide (TPR) repeat protein/transcriptional regulator with XRE-family HTH domain